MREQERIWGEDYVRLRNTALRRALVDLAPIRGRVLEVGCGAGRFIRTIARSRPDLWACGCDLSVEAVRRGRRYGDAVRFAAADLRALPYASECFDAVVLFDVLEHLADPAAGLAEIYRVLRRGGLLHALVPCEGQPLTLHWLLWKLNLAGDLKERHGAHVQRFTQEDLIALLHSQGFVINRLRFSMHPLGQLRDILTYLACEPWFARWHLDNLIYRILMGALWVAAYGESALLGRMGAFAVVTHVTAIRK